MGNVRLSYADSNKDGTIDPTTEIIAESNYYPFGLKHKGYNNVVSANGNRVAKKFGYNSKELQEEFGLNWIDYGARNYMPDIGRWTSIDPLAEKFYNEGPYHMAGNNPVVFMDYNGEDYILTINWNTGAITISGTLYATKEDTKAAQKAADNWNKQSGGFNYSFTDENGNKQNMAINYDISVQEVEVDQRIGKDKSVKAAANRDKSGGANAFVVVPDNDSKLPASTNGRNIYNYIRVKESKQYDDTATHEVGHALGVPHSNTGIMTAASNDPNRTSEINRTNVQNTVRNPIRGNTYNDGRGRATIQIKANGAGVKPPSTTKGQKRFKKGKVKKND